MGLSRPARIYILLVIDSTFFVLELVTGNIVGSLALIADSFHMLNDVMSLVVALYAIKLAKKRGVSDHYSYGWHRAEILATIVNGVFLLALCFNIFIEAIDRFFKRPELDHPRLIVIVGALGLLSNMLGLLLFHEHGHGHSHGHSHSHGHQDTQPPVQALTLPADTEIVEKSTTPSTCSMEPPASTSQPAPGPATDQEPQDLPPLPPPPIHQYDLTSSVFSAESPRPQSGSSQRRPETAGSHVCFVPAQIRADIIQKADGIRERSRPPTATSNGAGWKRATLAWPYKGRSGTAHSTRTGMDTYAD
ncbi:hypothetical protein FRB94_002216, partial [Tulasnella sp. JGI-2019a]